MLIGNVLSVIKIIAYYTDIQSKAAFVLHLYIRFISFCGKTVSFQGTLLEKVLPSEYLPLHSDIK